VEHGASVVCLRAGAPNVKIVGVDLDNSKAPTDLDIEYHTGDSYQVLKMWPSIRGEIDVLFVDGDHSYKGVQRDCGWTNFVLVGGYAVFHDCYDFDDTTVAHKVVPGVNQAVADWKRSATDWQELEPVGTCRVFRRVK